MPKRSVLPTASGVRRRSAGAKAVADQDRVRSAEMLFLRGEIAAQRRRNSPTCRNRGVTQRLLQFLRQLAGKLRSVLRVIAGDRLEVLFMRFQSSSRMGATRAAGL